jgi:hypothetical protein
MPRAKVACEGGKMMRSAELAGKSGAMVFRQAPKSQAVAAVPHPEFTLFGLRPVFEVRPPGKLVVERLDQPGERHEIAVTEQQLVRGAFLDFAKSGVALVPGGVYRAKLADQEIVFKNRSRRQAGRGAARRPPGPPAGAALVAVNPAHVATASGCGCCSRHRSGVERTDPRAAARPVPRFVDRHTHVAALARQCRDLLGEAQHRDFPLLPSPGQRIPSARAPISAP